MAKAANTQRPTELPAEALSRLDPKLRELCSQLHPDLASRISFLVREALPQGIDPNRVVRYAFLYATAERLAQGNAVSKEHTRRSKRELAGEIQGLLTGYRDQVEATQRYRMGRRARQQIQASLHALLGQWQVFEQVVEKHRSGLPVHTQSRFSKSTLGEIGKALHNMRIATILDEEDLCSEKHDERDRSVIAQTYIWWRLKVVPYRGRWNDMHQLAFAWRMSPTASVRRFRSVVCRVSNAAICVSSFGTSWDSVLSEKV